MRGNATAPEPLEVSPEGVLFLPGYGASIRVDAGMLHVRGVIGGHLREQWFPKVGRPRLQRLVLLGKGGLLSLDALAWIAGVGASFIHLANDGRILASSGEWGTDIPGLRRAQAQAAGSETGLRVARYLIGEKLSGQRRALVTRGVPDADAAASLIEDAIRRVEAAGVVDEITLCEAQAAGAYWAALSTLQLRFSKADAGKLPPHWRTAGSRASALTGQPRTATTAAHAIWNYLYRLLEAESRLACLGAGLDPGIGIVHADQRARDNLALDIMETGRPEVDAFVIRLLSSRTFSRREFVELPNGNARLTPPLARMLSSTLPRWLTAVAPVAERVARMLADSSARPMDLPTHLTGSARSRGRDGIRKGPVRKARPRSRPMPSACRTCGLVLEDPRRLYCDDCLPQRRDEAARSYLAAGLAGLARRRAEGTDTSGAGSGRWKVGAANAEHQRAIKTWEANKPAPDPATFEREILPLIRGLSLSRLRAATGLSLRYCSLIRRGLAVPHARHWEVFRGASPEEFEDASSGPEATRKQDSQDSPH